MHEKVEQYILKKEKELEAKRLKERDDFLRKLRLYEKIYSEKNEASDEFPEWDWDENGHKRFYKYQIIEVTDEEYEKICALTDVQEEKTIGSNGVATALKAIAIVVYILAFIVGLMSVSNPFMMLTIWVAYFVVGTLFLGFAEIVRLLNVIAQK